MAEIYEFTLRPVKQSGAASSTDSSSSAHCDPPPSPSPSSPPPLEVDALSAFINDGSTRISELNGLRQDQLRASNSGVPRPYPPPSTGLDIMRLFPVKPPSPCLELRGGPTSRFFQRQERAYFAQAGREEIRVRRDIQYAPHSPSLPASTPAPSGASCNGVPPSALTHFPASHPPFAGASIFAPGYEDTDSEPYEHSSRRRVGKQTRRPLRVQPYTTRTSTRNAT